MLPSTDQQKWIYQNMLVSRFFEQRIMALYMEGKQPVFDLAAGPLPGDMHLSYGQEAAVALCAAVEEKDWLHAGHRPHTLAIGQGVDLDEMAAELLGKKSGLSGGRGGHMHIYDNRVNFAASSIIGEQMPAAVGFAMACRARGDNSIAISVIGDGAANQGAFHEALNFAAVQKLPYICVIEDNNWAVTTSKEQSTAVKRNSDRASAYGIPGAYVEGNDPDKIYEASMVAFEHARSGKGPYLLEIETIRMMGHFHPDPAPYISDEERAGWVDCVPHYAERLVEQGVLTAQEAEEMSATAEAKANSAIDAAVSADYPQPEEALEQVFAQA